MALILGSQMLEKVNKIPTVMPRIRNEPIFLNNASVLIGQSWETEEDILSTQTAFSTCWLVLTDQREHLGFEDFLVNLITAMSWAVG